MLRWAAIYEGSHIFKFMLTACIDGGTEGGYFQLPCCLRDGGQRSKVFVLVLSWHQQNVIYFIMRLKACESVTFAVILFWKRDQTWTENLQAVKRRVLWEPCYINFPFSFQSHLPACLEWMCFAGNRLNYVWEQIDTLKLKVALVINFVPLH